MASTTRVLLELNSCYIFFVLHHRLTINQKFLPLTFKYYALIAPRWRPSVSDLIIVNDVVMIRRLFSSKFIHSKEKTNIASGIGLQTHACMKRGGVLTFMLYFNNYHNLNSKFGGREITQQFITAEGVLLLRGKSA